MYNYTFDVDVPEDHKAYVDKYVAFVTDPTTTTDEVAELLYSLENPMTVERTGLDNVARGWANGDTVQNPVWQMMVDLYDRKRIAMGELDWGQVVSTYDITLDEAADLIGKTPESTAALLDKRARPMLKDGRPYYDSSLLRRFLNAEPQVRAMFFGE